MTNQELIRYWYGLADREYDENPTLFTNSKEDFRDTYVRRIDTKFRDWMTQHQSNNHPGWGED